jgi:hypothetical protein
MYSATFVKDALGCVGRPGGEGDGGENPLTGVDTSSKQAHGHRGGKMKFGGVK